jgi:hypothetical protein
LKIPLKLFMNAAERKVIKFACFIVLEILLKNNNELHQLVEGLDKANSEYDIKTRHLIEAFQNISTQYENIF